MICWKFRAVNLFLCERALILTFEMEIGTIDSRYHLIWHWYGFYQQVLIEANCYGQRGLPSLSITICLNQNELIKTVSMPNQVIPTLCHILSLKFRWTWTFCVHCESHHGLHFVCFGFGLIAVESFRHFCLFLLKK